MRKWIRVASLIHGDPTVAATIFSFTRSLIQDCIALPSIDAWTSTPLEDEVVVACLLDRNANARDQAIFIVVVAYLGDGTVYAWPSSSRCWWSELVSSTTISRTSCNLPVVQQVLWWDKTDFCASIRSLRWLWNNDLFHRYSHINLDLGYFSIKGAIIHMWYSPVSTPLKAYPHRHGTTTARGGGG
jgi:hypothetical protein